jgi:serine/threonine protein kinase/uncharacterized membrane protein
MRETREDRDPLELLAAEFIDRQRNGLLPSVSEYAEKYPELADEIRELFPTIVAMERLKTHKEQTSGVRMALGALKLERLGDFRILGEIGRGGMGIVYEAFQESLGRHVAVKVLPRQLLLHATQLQRFQREAQTAARLHHTNIVPVFGVGEQDGFHYIVMQLIRGVGLDMVLAALRGEPTGESPLPCDAPAAISSRNSSEVTSIARMLLEGQFDETHAAEAVAFEEPAWAQSLGTPPRGILRSGRPIDTPTEDFVGVQEGGTETPRKAPTDMPPSSAPAPARMGPAYWRNVAAIGLQAAEALHHAHVHHTLHRDIKPANLLLDRQGMVWITDFGLAKAMEQDHVTQTGGLVGTLRYMAPEQFSGQIDARSDLYSLGLTLYELLTLRPGFEDSSRSGLIGQITHGEPVRPRKINPQIPRDLETITLKAIARDPAHRYQSAGELARDLQCYLEDRPIQARRVSAAERLWRWARRNRVVTALGTSTLLLLVVTVVLTSLGYVGSRHAKMEEEKLRRKAEATSALALEALDNIFQKFAPDRATPTSRLTVVGEAGEEFAVPVQPVLSKEAAAMLEHMLAFYDRLAEQSGDDARLRRKVAEANRRVGDIRQRLGHFEESKAAYLRAIAAYQQLAVAAPADTELRTEIARIQNELGNVYWAIHNPEAGHSSYVDALATLQAVPAAATAEPQYQYELARTYYFLGKRPGHEPGPPPISFGGRLGPGAQAEGPPWGRDVRKPEAGWHGPPPDGPPPEEPRGDPAARKPGDKPPFRKYDPEEQQENLHKAIDLLERLVADHPQVPDYRHLLARCYREVRPARWDRDLHRPDPAAAEAVQKATQILQTLAREYPDVPDYRQDLCETYAMLDQQRMFAPQDAAQRSRAMMEKGLAISEELVAEHPNVPDYALTQVYIRLRLAGLLQQSDPAAAQTHLEKALELQTTLVRRFPQAASYNMWMAVVQESLGMLFQQRGQLAEARKLQQASIESVRKLLTGDSHAGMLRGLLAYKYTRLADLLRQMKDEPAATEALQQVEQLRQRQ